LTEIETVVVATRLTPEDHELLRKVCEARGENFSIFLRRALRGELARLSYYSPDVKRALGVKINENGDVQE
jgi:hypothetical protein